MHFVRMAIPSLLISLLLAGAAMGEVVVQEDFDYGGASASLNGNNGDTGFSGAWSGTGWNYTPAGLAFSDLSSTGGAAT